MGSPPNAAPHSQPTPGSVPVPRTAAGRDGLAALLAHPERAVIALDFDGTLADIVPDPEKARAHDGAVAALGRLAPRLRAAAVITGRPATVAVRLGGFAEAPGLDQLTVLGHYGAERWEAATGTVHAPTPPPASPPYRPSSPASWMPPASGTAPGSRPPSSARAAAPSPSTPAAPPTPRAPSTSCAARSPRSPNATA